MSVTTLENPAYQTITQALIDYDLHHSGDPESPADASAARVNPRSHLLESRPNPEDWPTNHRRMPNYRPINRDLDMEQRPGGSNRIEYVFIFLMLNGVGLNASVAQTWHNTIGRWTGVQFKYKIGGEI